MQAHENALKSWSTILGPTPTLHAEYQGRGLWPVTASSHGEFFLKRLDPWRNLPIADEARVLVHLAREGIRVPELLLTESATITADVAGDQFVLQPRLASESLTPAEILASENVIGREAARLHAALRTYPWPVNSYTENLAGDLASDLLLPAETMDRFRPHREEMIRAITNLPIQPVHGDFTPENILLSAPGVVSGFIDFDHLPLAPRVWDIGKYLSRRMRTGWRGPALSPGPDCLDHIRAFLNGYGTIAPLTEAEITALPAMMLAGNILESSYYLKVSTGVLERRILADHDVVTSDAIAAANWHMDNVVQIVTVVRAATTS